MASTTQEEILKRFEDAAGTRSGGGVERSELDPGSVAAGIGASATPAGQDIQGGPKTEADNSGGASTAETVMKDVFESGLGVVPLISGLVGLFGGGSDSPPPLLKYQMPSAISFMSADMGDQLSATDYDQTGSPRLYDTADIVGAAGSGAGTNTPTAAGGSGSSTTTGAAQITFNVQAMDAQSFLDHSSDIAQAVRSAMLNMSTINDVVSEL